MRITFHLGEDEVPRFEIASHVSGARPGVRAQGGGVAVRTARGCGRAHGSRGSRGGGRGRMPRGVPTRLPGPRALRLRWRAGRLCPRPRKPPAPPAAAEASQRL